MVNRGGNLLASFPVTSARRHMGSHRSGNPVKKITSSIVSSSYARGNLLISFNARLHLLD